MLSYEGDGVRWWQDQQARWNRSDPPQRLILTWVTPGDVALVARLIGDAIADLERLAEAAGWGLSRDRINVHWGRSAVARWVDDHLEQQLASLVEHEGEAVDLSWLRPAPKPPSTQKSRVNLSARASYLKLGIWEWTLTAGSSQQPSGEVDLAAGTLAQLLHRGYVAGNHVGRGLL